MQATVVSCRRLSHGSRARSALSSTLREPPGAAGGERHAWQARPVRQAAAFPCIAKLGENTASIRRISAQRHFIRWGSGRDPGERYG